MDDCLRRIGIPPEAIIEGLNIDYLHPLGGGSDATVYPGSWNVPVAVKALHATLIQPGNDGREAFVARFGQECLRLRDLRHESIVQFMCVCTTRDGGPGLVTEKMAETLERRYRSGQLTVREQVDIFCDILTALAYLHSQGFVHRDLTARNVLLTERSRGGIAKVADVGLSRSLGAGPASSSRLTQCPGTLLYMPPEAFISPPTYNEKLDMFSLGVLMMSTIVGREPSQELFFSATSLLQADGNERPIPELQRRTADFDAIPDEHPAKRLICQCLQNIPSARPSAREALAELRGLCSTLRHSGAPLRTEAVGCFDCRLKDSAIAEKDAALAVKDHRITQLQETISKLSRTIKRRDAMIDDLQCKKDMLEEHFFIEKVRAYNVDLDASWKVICEIAFVYTLAQRGIFSRILPSTATDEFPKWESIPSPFPDAVKYRCQAVVHLEHLYACFNSDPEGYCLWYTSDATQWKELQRPLPSTILCCGLLSHDEHLYFLAVDHDHHTVLYELSNINMDETDEHGRTYAIWQQLPNGRCPTPQIAAVGFMDTCHSSIILAGGRTNPGESDPISAVNQYSLTTNSWVKTTYWPDLLLPRNGPIPVSLKDHLHLLGGVLYIDADYVPAPLAVISLDLSQDDMREWKTDFFPPTKCECCGACKLFGTIVVAGGWLSGIQSSVYAFDVKNTSWLQLPSLAVSRQNLMLVFFQDQLLAIGGWNGRKYLSSVEKLSLSHFKIF